jgi:hypothetical protein
MYGEASDACGGLSAGSMNLDLDLRLESNY